MDSFWGQICSFMLTLMSCNWKMCASSPLPVFYSNLSVKMMLGDLMALFPKHRLDFTSVEISYCARHKSTLFRGETVQKLGSAKKRLWKKWKTKIFAQFVLYVRNCSFLLDSRSSQSLSKYSVRAEKLCTEGFILTIQQAHTPLKNNGKYHECSMFYMSCFGPAVSVPP